MRKPPGRMSERLSRVYSGVIYPRVIGEPGIYPLTPRRSRTSKFAQRNRKSPTPAEKRFKCILNTINDGVLRQRFTNQYVVAGKHILDFFIPEVRLGIEIDGVHHSQSKQGAKDRLKERACKKHEITLVRFSNDEVFGCRKELIDKLRKAWKLADQQRRQWQLQRESTIRQSMER